MTRLSIVGWVAVVAAGCGNTGPAAHAVRLGPALTAMLAAADHTRAPWRCSGSRELAPDAAFGPWELRSGILRPIATDSKPLVIGFVADAAGNASATMTSLGRLRTVFERAGVNLVLTLGGMGSTQGEIAATLGMLAGGWPVVALPGDLEAMSAHVAAIGNLRARGAAVIDGRGVRSIEAQDALMAVVPGVGSAFRTTAGSDGCVWSASDVADAYRELSSFAGLRIAASAEAPREIIDGEPTGEVALAPQVPVDVVVHGSITAAPSPDARGERSGTSVSLSPGSADVTTRLPPSGKPAAGVLTIRGRTWEWRAIIDLPPHSLPGSAAHPGTAGVYGSRAPPKN